MLVLSATIAWAATAVSMRKYLRSVNAGVVTFYRFLFASIFFVIYLSLTSTIRISNIYQILVGISIVIGTILYYESLEHIKAAQISGLELSAPFFATILAFIVLGESITIMQFIRIFLLFVVIYYISKNEEL